MYIKWQGSLHGHHTQMQLIGASCVIYLKTIKRGINGSLGGGYSY